MEPKILSKGHILISKPILNDMNFNRTVVLLTEHGHEGTVGFILNKPLSFCIDELVPILKVDFPVYEGGPVAQDSIYYLHTRPDIIGHSKEIYKGLYWAGSYEDVQEAISADKIKSDEIRFYLGYSGWGSGQLEREVSQHSWIVMKDEVNIFRNWGNNLWKNQLKKLGGDFLIWINAPDNPSLN